MRLRSSFARSNGSAGLPGLYSLIEQEASLEGDDTRSRLAQGADQRVARELLELVPSDHTGSEGSPSAPRGSIASLDSSTLPALGDNPELLAQIRTALLNLEGAVEESGSTTPIFTILGVEVPVECALIAANLALVCARSGNRVLLVDANLNCPIHDSLLQVGNRLGVGDLLSSNEFPRQFIQSTPVENLSLMTTGPTVSNPTALLDREKLTHRLLSAASDYDLIMIDCGALSPQVASRVAVGSTGAVLAAREGISSVRQLQDLTVMLDLKKVHASGVILMA